MSTICRRLVSLLWLSLNHVTLGDFCDGSRLFDQAVASACTSIGGDLIISNIQSPFLDSLELTSIGGSLVISANPSVKSLFGLRVHAVGGMLAVSYNPALVNLTGLENMNVVGGVNIVGNHELRSLDGLRGSTFSDSMVVETNQALLRPDVPIPS